ncbi:histidine kinase [Croceitalea dokdonensis DOKDO 023]|uniref:histidine kinase n=1 Tax=Croceitalea dokdonensis DOKDO 023 TaxID=1300341 RepID=A0A0P7ATA6_9FLAO|nr:ATP-binding protein [Croceitalea dokdonensis]KPM31184.1 histidine kinase [Croceitalea dokdonensis DOKDO 023]
MHTLLKRQIKKYFPKGLDDHPGLDAFFDSIHSSYSHYDDKLKMIQRATSLSSKELYEANKRLNKETENQRKVLEALSNAVTVMESSSPSKEVGTSPVNPQMLLENIEAQAGKIMAITKEKESLLKSLEQQNESLNNYAHMVSHDLKSPIRNVYCLVTWLLEDAKDITDSKENNVELIFQNLKKMDSLIDGILKHATIDSLKEKMTMVNLNCLVDEIVRTVYVPDHVNIYVKDELPTLYIGKYRMEQLFKNIIVNAITALEDKIAGTIEITCKQQEDGWLFEIKDNGKGIPEHLQAGIFNMFKKLENDSNATGIGLALVKKIINYYKGEVWLSSQEGVGTSFFFTIKTNL